MRPGPYQGKLALARLPCENSTHNQLWESGMLILSVFLRVPPDQVEALRPHMKTVIAASREGTRLSRLYPRRKIWPSRA